MYVSKKILQEITWCCQNAVWCRCYLIALSRQVFPPVALPHSSVLLLKSFKVQSPGIHAALAHLLFKVNITLCSIVLLFTGDLLQRCFSSIYRLQRNNNWLYIKCLQMQSLWYTNYTKCVCLVFFFFRIVCYFLWKLLIRRVLQKETDFIKDCETSPKIRYVFAEWPL